MVAGVFLFAVNCSLEYSNSLLFSYLVLSSKKKNETITT